MLPTFYSALTGLRAHATGLNVVGNNLANINTAGFKRGTINFSQLMVNQVGNNNGAVNPMQFGLGTRTESISPAFFQGAISRSGNNTNLALQGEGFFQVSDGTDIAYTRAGNFTFDRNGELKSSNGWAVLGYTQVDADGNVVRSGTPAPLTIDFEEPSPPRATQTVRYITNLSSETETGGDFQTNIDIWDDTGQKRRLNLTFTKDEAVNAWSYQFTTDEGTVVDGTGTVTFDAQGRLATLNGVDINDPAITNPTINVTGLPADAEGNTPGDLSFNWDLVEFISQPDGTITNDSYLTNFSGFSTNGTFFQDGFGSGDLNRIEFMQDGTMLGFFSNGETHALGAVAVANFNNREGLRQIDSNFYEATAASGEAFFAENNGGTVIFGGALESSNVDIADEFTDLIIHQRGYQSNSKSVTTADQILQEILGLKR
ncbi:flagellar hook protein FlgE [Acanthopleuribacter pedis]|uniref:Flagellar hook protein FlgE n=1 Tax=Acanthopleuribacter pedis TaxID=442870 RepID=A0A8J7U883_9BACT|nr:flagellar hook protein FlgE [Acanthopleuribacter pedis]MBO1323293.1 flagellar hook protein FlgE [Acanthopleuribacter pedis]